MNVGIFLLRGDNLLDWCAFDIRLNTMGPFSPPGQRLSAHQLVGLSVSLFPARNHWYIGYPHGRRESI